MNCSTTVTPIAAFGRRSFTAHASSTGSVGGEAGVPVDPQRLVDARDEEEQADAGPVHDVGDRVEQVVAGEVGDREVLVVEHDDEARRTALRRDVGGAVGRARADEDEG